MLDLYISPSDQGRNTYAAGNTNEEVQCERIAAAVEVAAKRCGVDAFANLKDDMYTKVADANKRGTRLYLCIHTNAFNEEVSGTRIFCYSFTGEGYKAAVCVFDELAPVTPGTSENIKEYPALYEVRNTNAPCVYIEVDFHDVDEVALWIIGHTEEIAEAIVKGLCKYFGKAYVPATAQLPDMGDVAPPAEYDALMEKYVALQRAADEFALDVVKAVEAFNKKKGA